MKIIPACPSCNSGYGYEMDGKIVCPECSFEWTLEDSFPVNNAMIKDANGNILANGDTVLIVKDLPVKGAAKAIKAGTKVKNIRLVDGDHNIDCKIDGFGAMALKSEFVRKV